MPQLNCKQVVCKTVRNVTTIQSVNQTVIPLSTSSVQRMKRMLQWFNLSIKLQLLCKQVVYNLGWGMLVSVHKCRSAPVGWGEWPGDLIAYFWLAKSLLPCMTGLAHMENRGQSLFGALLLWLVNVWFAYDVMIMPVYVSDWFEVGGV